MVIPKCIVDYMLKMLQATVKNSLKSVRLNARRDLLYTETVKSPKNIRHIASTYPFCVKSVI